MASCKQQHKLQPPKNIMTTTITNTTICFDLDGTLVDTSADLLEALRHAMATKNLKTGPNEKLRQIIGEGAREMIVRSCKFQGATLSKPEIDDLWKIMVDYYKQNISELSTPYAGATEAIDQLKSQGVLITLCTNKAKDLTDKLLNDLSLTKHFDAITCGDSFDFKKPDPNHLWETIKRANGDPKKAIMIGDSKNDIHAARNASLPVIGVDWGYTDIPMIDLKPDLIISGFDGLQDAVLELSKEM